MTGLEVLEKLEDTVSDVINNRRNKMDWHKDGYEKLPESDPRHDYHVRMRREAFREVQTLKLVLIWIDDLKEECEEP